METDKRISRREALTRMGMIVAGAAASSIGLPALTSCTEKPQKKRIILYFTATGNCLHVARQLAESEEQLLSIPQMVKQNQYEFEADEIGLVYPIYGHMPPNMVRNFIKKAKLKAAYKFAVLTYGARKCDSVEIWNDISSKAGNKFDYINTLVMVDNWLPNFDMNEQIKIDKHTDENLATIIEELAAQKEYIEKGDLGWFNEEGLERLRASHFPMKAERLIAINQEKCIGCGFCTRVCPRGNLKLTGDGIRAEGSCEYCLACVHNCTQKALTLRSPMAGRPGERNPEARYRHPDISINEIVRANQQ